MLTRLPRQPLVTMAVLALLAVTAGGGAAAQEPPEGHEEGEGPHAAAGHGEHGWHRHHVSVFLGVTDGEAEAEGGHGRSGGEQGSHGSESYTQFTWGLDYAYRLSRLWGLGALVDYAAGDSRTWIWGIPLSLYPTRGLQLLAAPGLEHHEAKEKFLVRLGLMYHFEVGRFTVAPAFNLDIVDGEETLVYGLNFGRGF